MAKQETAPTTTHDAPIDVNVWATEEPDVPVIDDHTLLELRGVFYAPVDADFVADLPIDDRAAAVAVVPTLMLGHYIKDKMKKLNAEAKHAQQNSPTVVSSSGERISYANTMGLIGGQKLVLRELIEFFLEVSLQEGTTVLTEPSEQ